MDPRSALDISCRLVAAGLVIWAMELYSIRQHFRPAGVFNAQVGSLNRGLPPLVVVIDRFLPQVLALQAVSALTLVWFGPFGNAGRVALPCALATFIAVRWRRRLGGDGAEQMAAIVLLAAFAATVPVPGEVRITAAVLFVAGQVTLSYATAGIAKAISPVWRGGTALPLIFSTDGHGGPRVSRVFSANRSLALVACWMVIFYETTFVLMILGPEWMVLAALAAGFAFHIGCAVLMGLNSFLWAFPATYPCVYVASIQLQEWLISA